MAELQNALTEDSLKENIESFLEYFSMSREKVNLKPKFKELWDRMKFDLGNQYKAYPSFTTILDSINHSYFKMDKEFQYAMVAFLFQWIVSQTSKENNFLYGFLVNKVMWPDFPAKKASGLAKYRFFDFSNDCNGSYADCIAYDLNFIRLSFPRDKFLDNLKLSDDVIRTLSKECDAESRVALLHKSRRVLFNRILREKEKTFDGCFFRTRDCQTKHEEQLEDNLKYYLSLNKEQ